MVLDLNFREFVQLLNEKKINYLVVGGYAVGYWGYPRFTGDLDIWIEVSETNAEGMISVIKDFGFGSLKLTKQDFLIENNIVQIGYPPLRIDILGAIDGVLFESCYKHKINAEIDGLQVNFIHYSDLIENKKASNRFKDLDDIEHLNKLNKN